MSRVEWRRQDGLAISIYCLPREERELVSSQSSLSPPHPTGRSRHRLQLTTKTGPALPADSIWPVVTLLASLGPILLHQAGEGER